MSVRAWSISCISFLADAAKCRPARICPPAGMGMATDSSRTDRTARTAGPDGATASAGGQTACGKAWQTGCGAGPRTNRSTAAATRDRTDSCPPCWPGDWIH
ncbi:MAG TPA: hypothetical protein PKG77_18605 [Phycisphaerae bacterium]|nr:hypothetical protein [Phycisphaerae bacterium]HQL76010.1 hypothetical protein [Phycisphaerae bacterium]